MKPLIFFTTLGDFDELFKHEAAYISSEMATGYRIQSIVNVCNVYNE